MINLPTIHELRKNGYKIRVINKRIYTEFDPVKRKLNKKLLSKYEAGLQLKFEDCVHGMLSKGGYTRIELTSPQKEDFSAETYCSKNDVFCKKRGINITLGRIAKLHKFLIQ